MIPNKTAWLSLAILIPFSLILILVISYYLPFISDDSLISLRYVNRLLNGHGLTWTKGIPVEGYSNLLWILLIAVLGMLDVELINATRILGFIGMNIIMFTLLYYYLNKEKVRVVWFPLAITLLFLSVTGPIAVWAIGGLEQPLFGALIAISILLMNNIVDSKETIGKNQFRLSFVLGLLCITRPDGPIFTIASVISLLFISQFFRRKKLILTSFYILTFPILFYVGQIVFRLCYYGEFIPNTALVKITPSYHHFINGLNYLKHGIISLFPFSAIAIIFLFLIIFTAKNRAKSFYLLSILIFWSIYLVFIGGDIFPAYRHFIPIIVVFAFLLVEGFCIITKYISKSSYKQYYFLTLFVILFIPYTFIQFNNAENRRAIHEHWEWEGKSVGLFLKNAFSTKQPLLAVTAAGCLPYWSKLPALDMLGLNDYYLPRHPPKDIGNGRLAHELGSGKYVLRRKPDIIVFHVGTVPIFRSGEELQKTPEFHKLYIPIVIKTSDNYLTLIYFNKYSKKIGIQTLQSKIIIPGFLFKGKNSIAYLNKTNKLVVQVKSGQPLYMTFHSNKIQKWSINIKSTNSKKILSEIKQNSHSIYIKLFSKSVKPIEIENIVLKPECS